MDVVTGDWLADRLDEDGLRVVDTREEWEYDGIGHLPGAVNVPFDAYRGEDGEAGKLPGAAAFSALLGEAGIAPGDVIVAYDDTHGVFAARFLVTCELYGHDTDRLHLLNGDFSAWEGPVSREPPTVTPTSYDASFVGVGAGALVDMATVAAAIDDEGTVVVDTREEWEYAEGHLPGAVRLDWLELVDGETRGLRPETELRDLLADRGIDPDRRVVLYCNTARRISHTYAVLRHLGYLDLAFYEGSLTEWEAAGRELVTE